MVRFDLGPPLHGQTRIAKLKSAYNLIIIGPRGFGMLNQPIGNHGLSFLMWSGLTWAPHSRSYKGSQT